MWNVDFLDSNQQNTSLLDALILDNASKISLVGYVLDSKCYTNQ